MAANCRRIIIRWWRICALGKAADAPRQELVRLGLIQPAAGEPDAPQSADDMRVFPHHLPHQSAAIILHHREDRSLIDAEIVVRDPTVEDRKSTRLNYSH